MEEIKLDVQVRTELGKTEVKKVRHQDCVPAVVYGGKKEATVIKIDRRSYERIRRQHQGEGVVFHLNVLEGEKKLRDYAAIVREEQHDPVSDEVLHVDFKRISLKEKLEIKVSVRAVGEEPAGVKQGGSLDHHIWELDIICLPTQIPECIDVDASALEIGDAIHVKDLVLPEGVVTNHDPEDIVLSVVPPMKEEELEAEAEEGEEPEVIKKEKGEDDQGEDKAEEPKEDAK